MPTAGKRRGYAPERRSVRNQELETLFGKHRVRKLKGFALRGMVPSPTPKRDHGDPRYFRLRSEGEGKLVRAEGLEPSRTLRSNGFSYLLRLSPPLLFCQGLGSGLSLHHVPDRLRVSGAARLASTPSQPFPGWAWLGIAMLQGSPNLSSSASPVSRRALKFSLKSDASADSATPARFQVSTIQRTDPIGLLSPLRLPVSPPGHMLMSHYK